MASFVLSFFPLDVLNEIWDLIESVSEGFLTYSFDSRKEAWLQMKMQFIIWKPRQHRVRLLFHIREGQAERTRAVMPVAVLVVLTQVVGLPPKTVALSLMPD